jgi:uncharacterized protein YecE (DUF72 family)
MSQVRVGIIGWIYPPWRGGSTRRACLKNENSNSRVATGQLDRDQRFILFAATAQSYRSWYYRYTGGFVLAVKGARFITHLKRLKDVEKPAGELLSRQASFACAKTWTDSLATPPKFSI